MSTGDWSSLYRSLQIKEYPGRRRIRQPTDLDLDKFESSTRFKLPVSYREFIKVFGPGTLGVFFRIAAPGYSSEGDPIDLAAFNSSFKGTNPHDKSRWRRAYGDDAARVERMVMFALTDAVETIGW